MESFLLSDVGLETALSTLGPKEIALLHLLNLDQKVVKIDFFAYLYKSKKSSSSFGKGTPTQRYSTTFKSVQTQLIRKGVLLIDHISAASKMEGWQFAFPTEFAKFLPAPFTQINHFANETGDIDASALPHKIASLIDRACALPNDQEASYQICLKNGQLMLGDSVFSSSRLMEWRQSYWQHLVDEKDKKKSTAKKTFSYLVHYAFEQLGPDEWIDPEALSTFLSMAYSSSKPPKPQVICEIGWELGYFARHIDKGTQYYRLASAETTSTPSPDKYLQCQQAQSVLVDLPHIPFDELALLNDIADFRQDNTGLYAVPNLIKMGHTTTTTQQHILFDWLKTHTIAFSDTIKTLEKKQGKQIVHDNLLMAKVKDLSLKVQIQKALKDTSQLVELPNGFIAFAADQLPTIERIIKKAGYAIKTRTD